VTLTGAKSVVPPDAPVTEVDAATTVPAALGSIDLLQAKRVKPKDAPVKKMAEIAQKGVALVQWILVMISIFVTIALIWIMASEFLYQRTLSTLSSDTAISSSKELIEFSKASRTEFREFWLKIFQMVLLNVLLPVLTALLGYVFGSRQQESE
jgi:hypothetical protein